MVAGGTSDNRASQPDLDALVTLNESIIASANVSAVMKLSTYSY
jgi:hypothetical protein